MRNALDEAVDDFVSEVGAALVDVSSLAGRPLSHDQARRDAATEAFTLACAVIDADGRVSDTQLWGLISAFAGKLTTSIASSTPNALREAGLLATSAS
ncbi:MAG: hypothetical protein OEY23_11915, partial [Acidimicrobiia bacterium]|nr:hypothetical protein [Acidimicrobiia bacterium]